MPQNEAQSWWADVADVRESIERRRAGDAPAAHDEGAPSGVDELAHVRARRRRVEREQGRSAPRRSGRFDRDRDHGHPAAAAPAPQPEREPAPAPAAFTPPADAPRRPLVAPVPRRTVQITGRPGARTTPRLVEIDRRRAARGPAERLGPRPDKLAMWAVMLGLFLILVAATSSHA
ncbi:MAG: hypothetical protein ACXVFN_12315 [Solirubrobacteraceae bacterium]